MLLAVSIASVDFLPRSVLVSSFFDKTSPNPPFLSIAPFRELSPFLANGLADPRLSVALPAAENKAFSAPPPILESSEDPLVSFLAPSPSAPFSFFSLEKRPFFSFLFSLSPTTASLFLRSTDSFFSSASLSFTKLSGRPSSSSDAVFGLSLPLNKVCVAKSLALAMVNSFS